MNNTSKHSNGSADHHSESENNFTPETIFIINCVLNAPLMLISILGNALVLAAIMRTPSIRSAHMIMFCSLAISDFLVGLVTQPIYIAGQLTKNNIVCNGSELTGTSLCIVSLMTITAITVDRFLALHYHLRYATLVTESRVKYTFIIIWLISLLVSGFDHDFWSNGFRFTLGSVVTICLAICTFSYIRIYRIVRRHQLEIHAQQQTLESSTAENNLNTARLKRSTLNTFVFYIALIICYLPIYVLSTLRGLSIKDWQTELDFAHTVVFMNSSINPILYCWRLRDLRTAIVKTERQMLCKQREEN